MEFELFLILFVLCSFLLVFGEVFVVDLPNFLGPILEGLVPNQVAQVVVDVLDFLLYSENLILAFLQLFSLNF